MKKFILLIACGFLLLSCQNIRPISSKDFEWLACQMEPVEKDVPLCDEINQ